MRGNQRHGKLNVSNIQMIPSQATDPGMDPAQLYSTWRWRNPMTPPVNRAIRLFETRRLEERDGSIDRQILHRGRGRDPVHEGFPSHAPFDGLRGGQKGDGDAGLTARDIDAITSFQIADSTDVANVAQALGIRMNYGSVAFSGGSTTEALVAHSIGLIEAGYCNTVAIFRSMNGRTGKRMGGQAPGGVVPPTRAEGDNQFYMNWGWTTPAQHFGLSAMRCLRDIGATTKRSPRSRTAFRYHASLNPKAIACASRSRSRTIIARAGYPSRSGCWIAAWKPTWLRRFIVYFARARLRPAPAAGLHHGRCRPHTADNPMWNYSRPGCISVAGNYARQRLLGMAGISPKDIDFVSAL